MDEVHIYSVASYIVGKVTGSIDNADDPNAAVFSMMDSSVSNANAIFIFPNVSITQVLLKIQH